jgi:hypothetical protein
MFINLDPAATSCSRLHAQALTGDERRDQKTCGKDQTEFHVRRFAPLVL